MSSTKLAGELSGARSQETIHVRSRWRPKTELIKEWTVHLSHDKEQDSRCSCLLGV